MVMYGKWETETIRRTTSKKQKKDCILTSIELLGTMQKIGRIFSKCIYGLHLFIFALLFMIVSFCVCVCVFMYKSLLKVKNREKLRIAFLILFLPFSRLFLHALYSIFSSFFSPPKHIQTFAIIICIRRVYTRPEHYNIWIQTVNYHPIKLM